ncbi:hydrogenase expression/formation protein, partial [Aliarcobacter butzleri]
MSKENSVSLVDGGTLAQRLIPEIIKYDEVLIIGCIDAINSKAGDVF